MYLQMAKHLMVLGHQQAHRLMKIKTVYLLFKFSKLSIIYDLAPLYLTTLFKMPTIFKIW